MPAGLPKRAGGHFVQRRGAKVAIQTPKGRYIIECVNSPWAKRLYDTLVSMECEKDETPEALFRRALTVMEA